MRTHRLRSSSQQAWFFVIFCLSLHAIGCASHLDNGMETPDAGLPDDMGSGGGPRDLMFDPDAFWAEDPPPAMCLLDGGTLPPPKPPGGTPTCPDDKNRQGCPCPTIGETAACWPGLRKHRGLGSCQDGVTKCVQNGEFGGIWGACEGYVLPVPDAPGRDGCNCFSAGRWAIENVVPCFYSFNGAHIGAASAILSGGVPKCSPMGEKVALPPSPWSPNTLTVDCVGRWKLCYTIKAGDVKNPLPADCVVATACTQGDYPKANEVMPLPVLPAWYTSTPAQVACAEKFKNSGGYGEMSVDGLTVTCDDVKKMFNRVGYCPLKCNDTPMAPECKDCRSGGSGMF